MHFVPARSATPGPSLYGRSLTAEREKRGLSIEDVAHETRIHARWLRLLEEGNLAAFGGMTYARSFVRAYSAFLGVDASDFLQTLPAGGVLGGARDYRYLVHSHGPWLRESEYQASQRQLRPAARATKEPQLRRIKCPIPAGLSLFALMLTATALWGMHVTQLQPHVQAQTQSAAHPSLTLARSDGAPGARFAHLRTPVRRAVD